MEYKDRVYIMISVPEGQGCKTCVFKEDGEGCNDAKSEPISCYCNFEDNLSWREDTKPE